MPTIQLFITFEIETGQLYSQVTNWLIWVIMCAENVQNTANFWGGANFYSLLTPHWTMNLVVFMKIFNVLQEETDMPVSSFYAGI